MSCPEKAHWQAVKWILRYLRGTSNCSLEFGRNNDTLVSFVDSDYAGDLDRRRSLSGYGFCIGGCAVSWKATLQPVVVLSNTEAEYMAMIEAIKQALGLKSLFAELSLHQDTIAEGKVLVQKISTKENPADMFTKSLPVYKFKQYLNWYSLLLI
ncbi:secreted RxLR effector protein 161-like [Coffea arabica]|uniref:Secreted RxLR effector protein 161-like n=1 Tax=Coffea arabica TaxID=13443 RepID=A0ABM4V9P7_COFAR